jgi:hypothetical protein
MPIRFARYSDLPHVSSIFAESFFNEELHAHIFPHRREFPDDYQRAWYEKVLIRWWDYSRVFVVHYEEVETGVGKITGAAEWERAGEGWEKVWGGGRWDLSEFEQAVVFDFFSVGCWFGFQKISRIFHPRQDYSLAGKSNALKPVVHEWQA